MISKKYRFTTRVGSDFFAKAKRAYSPFFVLYFQKKELTDIKASTEIAVIVPKKYAFKATKRNKIKRKIKEVLTKNIPPLNNFKMVFLLKKNIKEDEFEKIDQEIKNLICKIK